jgi:hypothetical protein
MGKIKFSHFFLYICYMKINKMSLKDVTLELKRAKFWVEDNPIRKSLDLINRMENRKVELINKNLNNE